MTKPVIHKAKPLFERLGQPKKAFESTEPFVERDFRGLLNADFPEALNNCN